jgi:hypothetical protein
MFRSIVFSIVLASSAVAYNWNGRGGHPYIPPAPPSDKSKAEAPKVEFKCNAREASESIYGSMQAVRAFEPDYFLCICAVLFFCAYA